MHTTKAKGQARAKGKGRRKAKGKGRSAAKKAKRPTDRDKGKRPKGGNREAHKDEKSQKYKKKKKEKKKEAKRTKKDKAKARPRSNSYSSSSSSSTPSPLPPLPTVIPPLRSRSSSSSSSTSSSSSPLADVSPLTSSRRAPLPGQSPRNILDAVPLEAMDTLHPLVGMAIAAKGMRTVALVLRCEVRARARARVCVCVCCCSFCSSLLTPPSPLTPRRAAYQAELDLNESFAFSDDFDDTTFDRDPSPLPSTCGDAEGAFDAGRTNSLSDGQPRGHRRTRSVDETSAWAMTVEVALGGGWGLVVMAAAVMVKGVGGALSISSLFPAFPFL